MNKFNHALSTHRTVQLMREAIDITKEEKGFYRKLFVISGFNQGTMLMLFVVAYFAINFTMMITEKLIWGEAFLNPLDPFVNMIFIGTYIRATKRLSDLMIECALQGKHPDPEPKQPKSAELVLVSSANNK
ncbi:hypothetical protein NMR92_001265 [Vibrio cholerae]|uniref:Uncharacterized protein n=3 Tax=Vibrio TaxID=662 RepID=A0A1B1LRQ0_VIBPH|nr:MULTISPECIES: hypothetical protein [Vibrio]ANS55723.1 hypothetical protein [Vibrio parahaemolyticus]EJL6490365.1 hypothetical protein [Vibrio cholerae]EJL6642055.1 hypothetical protein [Vibrio cholerae]MBL4245121.1 hypothetical protein [Vibrio fluvialis]MBL4254055.1 hypothetical protein [Vibrio fluvialis]